VKPGLLVFYRIMAYVTAVLLILLCLAMAPKYLAPEGSEAALLGTFLVRLIGTGHGFLYIVYLFVALIVTVQLRVSLVRMVLVLLAGTVPFCAFVAERKVTHWHQLRLEGKPLPGEVVVVEETSESKGTRSANS
jgi:integral membrane protein